MDDQSGLINLDYLLVQLTLETRESAQKKNDLTQQIQIHKAGIEEKKKFIKDIPKTIKKLEEDIQQTENTIKCLKTNVKSLRATSDLLLQYQKMLETELEKRQESCNQDMKMFQERIENYRKIFQQHEEEYLQDPLARKLQKIQAESEELDRRIRVIEEEMTEKAKELKECNGTDDSVQKQLESNQYQHASACESETEAYLTQDSQVQDAISEQQDVKIEMGENIPEKNQNQPDGGDESNSSEVGGIVSTIWANTEIREHIQAADQQEHTAEDMNMNISTGSGTLENMIEAEEQQKQRAEDTAEEGSEERAVCPSSSPTHMSVLDIPNFCLRCTYKILSTEEEEHIDDASVAGPQLPGISKGHQVGRGTPAFAFSMNSGPNTPTFLGFDFEVSPSQHEESPFTFSSSYFNKKSPQTKLPGFLFDEFESHSTEDFEFSFTSKSPQSKESVGTGDTFPFSFNFGKF